VTDTYEQTLISKQCRCGAKKVAGNPFCSRCHSHLPKPLGYVARSAAGYAAAVAHFEKNAKRKSWRTFAIMQPWCYATVHGLRKYDTRSYKVDYRGPCAIASMKAAPDPNELPEWFQDVLWKYGMVREIGIGYEFVPELKVGYVLAVGILVDIIPADTVPEEHRDVWGRYDEGRWAWKFTDIRLTEPVESGLKSVTGMVKIMEKKV
jgi:hypothetical protein